MDFRQPTPSPPELPRLTASRLYARLLLPRRLDIRTLVSVPRASRPQSRSASAAAAPLHRILSRRTGRGGSMAIAKDSAAIVRRFWDLGWNRGELAAIDGVLDGELH